MSNTICMGINPLRPRQNGRHFADAIFKCIFLNENVWIPIKISLKFVPKGPINNIPALVQIMAWRRPGDKPLSETRMVRLPTNICVTRPQWVNSLIIKVNITLEWMPEDLFTDKSTMIQVTTWCCQATSHYLHHYWPKFLKPYGTTMPQTINRIYKQGFYLLPPFQ